MRGMLDGRGMITDLSEDQQMPMGPFMLELAIHSFSFSGSRQGSLAFVWQNGVVSEAL